LYLKDMSISGRWTIYHRDEKTENTPALSVTSAPFLVWQATIFHCGYNKLIYILAAITLTGYQLKVLDSDYLYKKIQIGLVVVENVNTKETVSSTNYKNILFYAILGYSIKKTGGGGRKWPFCPRGKITLSKGGTENPFFTWG